MRAWTSPPPRLGDFDDSLTQLLILGTLWDTVRDGQRPAQDYIATVLDNCCGSHALLGSAHSDASARDRGRVLPASGVTCRGSYRCPPNDSQSFFESVPGGTDQAFQFLRGFIKHATNQEQLGQLQSWLDASGDLVHGITIDTDLTWELIIALAAHDAIDDSAITAMTKTDPSATEEHARQRRHAALAPTSAAKTEGLHPHPR